jgi:hypothetical protein
MSMKSPTAAAAAAEQQSQQSAASAEGTANDRDNLTTHADDQDPGGQRVDQLAKGWKAALARCPCTLFARREARTRNDRGNLPLPMAASFGAPVEVVEALLEAHPEAASITNNYGILALHFTAWKNEPLECMSCAGNRRQNHLTSLADRGGEQLIGINCTQIPINWNYGNGLCL